MKVKNPVSIQDLIDKKVNEEVINAFIIKTKGVYGSLFKIPAQTVKQISESDSKVKKSLIEFGYLTAEDEVVVLNGDIILLDRNHYMFVSDVSEFGIVCLDKSSLGYIANGKMYKKTTAQVTLEHLKESCFGGHEIKVVGAIKDFIDWEKLNNV